MKLILCDIDPLLCRAWSQKFEAFEDVEIVNGRIENQTFDCLINAGNSFGFMDGGVDGAISRHYGWQLPERVQEYIRHNYRGEQPVGTSFIIPIYEIDSYPLLAHTPTMRVPSIIRHTDNVYTSFKAALKAIGDWNEWAGAEHIPDAPEAVKAIASVCCPGLGTSTGRVDAESAAGMMAIAYDQFINPPENVDWDYARLLDDSIQQYVGNLADAF